MGGWPFLFADFSYYYLRCVVEDSILLIYLGRRLEKNGMK